MNQPVKIAFASCSRDHIPAFLQRFDAIAPEAELWVVSEFQPPRGHWIPYRMDCSGSQNLAALRASLGNRGIRYAAVSLEPNSPYAPMRLMALRVIPLRTLFYNENLDHVMLRPQSWRSILRYGVRKVREYASRDANLSRAYAAARRAGVRGTARKRELAPAVPAEPEANLPAGISVVVPSRDGRDLLAELLPILDSMLEGRTAEVIVVDNGSTDDTRTFLASSGVRCDVHPEPLTFAKAVNRGIEQARYSHILLLNNDMRPHSGFIEPLLEAFDRIPDLFCATAQIFFPEGKRREETGKAVMPSPPQDREFPVMCAMPLEGEDLSPVLYGSGGCSLYDTAKLRALRMFSQIYEPAYVEDLDIGFRAWQRGWATVYAARAHVTHHHRSTTSRFYTPDQIEQITERNYLRFLMRSVGNSEVFQRLWTYAVDRLNSKAAVGHHQPSRKALEEADETLRFIEPAPAADEEGILAIGSGDVAVFPGQARPVPGVATVLIVSASMPSPSPHVPEFGQVLMTFVDQLRTPPPELLRTCVEIVQVRRTGSQLVEESDHPAFRAALVQTIRKWRPAVVQLESAQMKVYARFCTPAKIILV
jgi:O-antigen biosynthesis protein